MELSVLNPMNSLQSNHVTNGVQIVHITFFLTKHFNQNTIFATDKLTKWKVHQC